MSEQSPEQVAYNLLLLVANAEKKSLEGSMAGAANTDRKWLLDTYAECLLAIREPSSRRHVDFTFPYRDEGD